MRSEQIKEQIESLRDTISVKMHVTESQIHHISDILEKLNQRIDEVEKKLR